MQQTAATAGNPSSQVEIRDRTTTFDDLYSKRGKMATVDD